MLHEELYASEIVPSSPVAHYDRSFPITISTINKQGDVVGYLYFAAYTRQRFFFSIHLSRGRGGGLEGRIKL